MNWSLVFHDDAVSDHVRAAQVELVLREDVVVPKHEVHVLLSLRLLREYLQLLLEHILLFLL
jgi:hypothetical protein